MPLEATTHDEVLESDDILTPDYSDVDPLLFKDNGDLTKLGEAVAEFAESVNFGNILDNEELSEAVDVELNESEDEETESMAGAIVAAVLDEDDTAMLFDDYLEELAEDDSLSGKLKLKSVQEALQLDEKAPFKKGAFRAIRRQKGGAGLVNRMLGAMLAKGAITRTGKPGTGYKDGDYKKNASGYPAGRGEVGNDDHRAASNKSLGKSGKVSVKQSRDPGFGSARRWAAFKFKFGGAKSISKVGKGETGRIAIGGRTLKSGAQKKQQAQLALKNLQRVAKANPNKAKAVAAKLIPKKDAKKTTKQKAESIQTDYNESVTPVSSYRIDEAESAIASRFASSTKPAARLNETAE